MYQTFQTRGVSSIKCDAKCKAVTICDMRAMRAENGCVSQNVDCQFACMVSYSSLARPFPHLASTSAEVLKTSTRALRCS